MTFVLARKGRLIRPILFFAFCCIASARTAHGASPVITPLVPGLIVDELPVQLPNINNLRFSPNGELAALGCNGKVYLLSDTNGDGLEDSFKIFWDRPTIRVPVGMAWSDRGLYVSSHGKVSLLRDTRSDAQPTRKK